MNCSERIRYLETYQGNNRSVKQVVEYWKNAYQEISIRSIRLEPVITENGRAIYEKVQVTTKKGKTVSAKFIRLADDGPFPLLLLFHDLARPCRGWFHMTRFVTMGWAVMAIENAEQLTKEDLTDEILKVLYQNALILTKAAVMLPDIDSQVIGTWGEGFGGGLAIVSAALSEERTLCTCLNPLPAGRENPLVSIENFTPLLHGYFLMGTGMMDDMADPEGQFAAYNRAGCEKKHLVYPKFGHERINHFEDQHLMQMEQYKKEFSVNPEQR